MASLFNLIDKDKSGTISYNELKLIIKKYLNNHSEYKESH